MFKSINPLYPCVLAIITSSLLACAPKEQERLTMPAFDGPRAFSEVAALVEFSPRDGGTPEGRKAAEHILKRLKSHGVMAEIDTFKDQTPDGEKTFHNVIGRIPGKTDKWIILGSHFDTMPDIDNFQGANDSGSSTGVLLEAARLLADQNPKIGIMFAFFDGEEGIAHYAPGDGLHGSRHMAAQLKSSGTYKQVTAMILLDMVGDKDLLFTIPANSSQPLVKVLLKAAHTTGLRNRITLARDRRIIDDHVPFLEIGIPAIDIIDFNFGSAPGLNDYWHTSADDLEHISADSLQITGTILMEMLQQLATSP